MPYWSGSPKLSDKSNFSLLRRAQSPTRTPFGLRQPSPRHGATLTSGWPRATWTGTAPWRSSPRSKASRRRRLPTVGTPEPNPPRCDGSRLSLSRPVCLRATVQGSQEGKGAKVAKKAIIGRHLSQLVANAVGQHQAYELALAITALDPNGLRVFVRP